MTDAQYLVDDLHSLIENQALDGLGSMMLNRENTALTIWWKDGAVPAQVRELCDQSDVSVELLATPFSGEEVARAIAELVREARANLGPADFTSIGPSTACDRIVVEVLEEPGALDRAEAYFSVREVRTVDGRLIPVEIRATDEFGPVRAV